MTTPTQFEIECALISGAADDETRSANNKFPVPAGYTFYKNENVEEWGQIFILDISLC